MRFFFPLHFSFQSNPQNIETERQEETPDGNTNSKYGKKSSTQIFIANSIVIAALNLMY